jgi:uncharacterized protein (DUF1800 family)
MNRPHLRTSPLPATQLPAAQPSASQLPATLRRPRQRIASTLQSARCAALCAVLTASLAVGPALAEAPAAADNTAMNTASSSRPLTTDQKELHTLDRFTFGPTPAETAEIRRIGVKAWFDRQLEPQSIDDSALDAMLLKYPASALTQAQLMQRFPGPGELRRLVRNDGSMPTDPEEHAIYAVGAYEYQRKIQAAGAAKTAGAENPAGATAPDASMQNGMAQPEATQPDALQPEAMQSAAASAPVAAKGKGKRMPLPRSTEDPALVLPLPPDQRMAALYAMPAPQLSAFLRRLRPDQRQQLMAGLKPEQMETLAALQIGPIRVVGGEALQTRLLRDLYSERQLQAVMTDFWLNHFNVYVRKSQEEPYLLSSYEHNAILPHALGKFEDLLDAVAESPAMMVYLDNWQSVGPDSEAAARVQRYQQVRPNGKLAKTLPQGINENYARELMELHTLGVQCEVSADKTAASVSPNCDGGYTQADVQNVARVLTGWTVDRRNGYSFGFDARRHEPGSKQVLGHTIPAGGPAEGLAVLHLLATSPATAHFISHKLAVRFVSDNPSAALENRMAATFLRTGGDIKSVLRTMFDSPEFWSPQVYRAKVKTPLEFLTSAVRATDGSVQNPVPLVQSLGRLGMPLYGMQTPNGYSWQSDDWVSTNALVSRMNFAMVLSNDRMPGTQVDWTRLVGAQAADSPTPSVKTENELELDLVGQPVSDRTRTVVMEQADRPGQGAEAQKNFAMESTHDAVEEESAASMYGGLPAKNGAKAKARGQNALLNLSMTTLAGVTTRETPVSTMGGLLMGSPEFQRR